MDPKRPIHNLPIHEHPLFHSAMFFLVKCGACHAEEQNYGGYVCNNEPVCKIWFHKECAEAPPEINHHPSHSEHPLLLTNESQSGPCDFCGKDLLPPCYTCPSCEFKVDLMCGMKPSAPAIEHPVCHDHSLVFLKKQDVEVSCEACKESIGGPSYSCLECQIYFHLDCVQLSKEINHPCHSRHPLKVVSSESLPDMYAKKKCDLCDNQPEMMYHCCDCDFTMCFGCAKHPPPLVVEDIKTHEHRLRLVSNVAFTCKVCGIEGYETKPYICFECNFFVHGNCVGFPRVININRHDHRISLTHHHGRRGTKCGVCRRNISPYHGAYICSVCPNYTVHSRCAIDVNIWNGRELEEIPERTEDIAPFKVVGHNLIRHFSHSQHTLKLFKDYCIIDDDDALLLIRCEACICPVGVGPIYACGDCRFVLHEKCANLPMKKRLAFDPDLYTLEYDNTAIHCKPCGMYCDGFKYILQESMMAYGCVDVHCASLSAPFVHYAHSHPLYVFKLIERNIDFYCYACKRVPDDYILCCDTCPFYLCLYCATLPEKTWHRSDDEHPLILSCDGKASGENWCDVCETQLDPSKLGSGTSNWFYTCSDCEVALHVQCVLGDFSRLRPEWLYNIGGRGYKVILNNQNTRPFCSLCQFRCKVPLILKDIGKENGYICSLSCLSSCLGIEF